MTSADLERSITMNGRREHWDLVRDPGHVLTYDKKRMIKEIQAINYLFLRASGRRVFLPKENFDRWLVKGIEELLVNYAGHVRMIV